MFEATTFEQLGILQVRFNGELEFTLKETPSQPLQVPTILIPPQGRIRSSLISIAVKR